MTTSFNEEQYDLAYPDGIEFHWWNRYRSGLIARLCRGAVPEDARLLEVGCGRGGEVRALRGNGFNARGVELAPVPPLPPVTEFVDSDQDATTLPEEQRVGVAAILLLDVIEHLPEPATFLGELQQVYPDLETVIVTVPARRELWSNYDEFYGHYRRYSLPMLGELADELGWSRVRSGYFFQLLYLPMRIMSALKVERSTSIAAPAAGARWLHALVSAYHRLEEWLLPGALPGTSAYAVFRVKR